jgi:hypothetical protein
MDERVQQRAENFQYCTRGPGGQILILSPSASVAAETRWEVGRVSEVARPTTSAGPTTAARNLQVASAGRLEPACLMGREKFINCRSTLLN